MGLDGTIAISGISLISFISGRRNSFQLYLLTSSKQQSWASVPGGHIILPHRRKAPNVSGNSCTLHIIMHIRYFITLIIFALTLPSFNYNSITNSLSHDNVSSAHFYLSAFGVESDEFPTIDAKIDFLKIKSQCQATYDEPNKKPKSYTLSSKEIDTLSHLINSVDWKQFKKAFAVGITDQPTSTLTIKIKNDIFEIKDYGLQGDAPLPELYRIVYKLDQNFR